MGKMPSARMRYARSALRSIGTSPRSTSGCGTWSWYLPPARSRSVIQRPCLVSGSSTSSRRTRTSRSSVRSSASSGTRRPSRSVTVFWSGLLTRSRRVLVTGFPVTGSVTVSVVHGSSRSGAAPTTLASTGRLSGPSTITRSWKEMLLSTHQMPTTATPQRSANFTHRFTCPVRGLVSLLLPPAWGFWADELMRGGDSAGFYRQRNVNARGRASPSQVRLKRLRDDLLGLEADEVLDELAALEDQQGGDAFDVVRAGRALVRVDVELPDDVTAAGLGGELVDRRRDRAARRAPRGPRVNQHGLLARRP